MGSFTEHIMGDKPCDKCGYNLAGLPMGSKCPECGHSIRRVEAKGPRSGTMSAEAPTQFVKLLLAGFLILSASIIGIFFGPIIYWIVSLPFSASSSTGRALIGAVWVLVHALWPLGIWIITTRRPQTTDVVPGPILDNTKFRIAVRAVSVAWVLKAIFAVAIAGLSKGGVPATGFGAGTLLAGQLTFSFISWIGLVPTCIYIGELAFWSSNEAMGAKLRSTAWAMGVFGAISVVMTAIALTPFMISTPASMVVVICLIVVLIATFFFMFTIFQLTHVLVWVIKHQLYAAGSPDRVSARINAHQSNAGCITNGLKCQYCKFNLDGLPYGGRCPECGESYADSTPFPIRDPALTARDEPDLDLAESTNQEILQFEQLDSTGHKRPPEDDPDDGTIPLV